MALTTIDLTPKIGTEIKAEREELLSGVHKSTIRDLLEERGVLVIREIDFSDEEQLVFSRTIGDLIPQGDEGIFKVSLDPNENHMADYVKGSLYWHIDGWADDVPTRASLLSARVLPPTGGQTEVCNTYAAFEELPEAERNELEKLYVIHSMEAVQRRINPNPTPEQLEAWREFPPKTHPLVWHHQSGRKSLIVGSSAFQIKGMDPEEGRALLDRLEAWATQPRFVYRHEWSVGDLLIWDNTGVMHRAVAYDADSGRMMHRTTLVGEEPVA